MDRFLEEQEGVRDRSSSPNVHCLLYGDTKRQRSSASVTNNDEIKSETWDGNAVDPLADANGPTAAPPPPPPPPPPPLTTTTSSSMCNSSALTTSTYCSSSTRHTDCSSSESGYMNSTWSGLVSRSQPTSSVITTITINTTTATATSAAMITGLGSTNTVSTSSTAATAAATASNNYYHQRVTSSRSNDSHDTPSPENILPHLPP